MFFKERAGTYERYQEKCATASESKFVQLSFERYFLCLSKSVTASGNIFCFSRNVWLLLKRY